MTETYIRLGDWMPPVGSVLRFTDGRYVKVTEHGYDLITVRPYRWRLWGWVCWWLKGRRYIVYA